MDADAAMERADSEIKWLMAENDVARDVQAVIYHHRFNTVRMVIGLGEDRAEVKDVLERQFGLRAADGINERHQVATVLAAWTAARAYGSRETVAKADARANRMPRPIAATEHQAMRLAVEARVGKIENAEVHSKAYLGLKSEDVENNEITAEDLSEVTSKNDTEVETLSATLDNRGHFVVKKATQNGKMPTTTEELRTKLNIIGNCWLFLKSKHSNRPWLLDMDEKVFKSVADHILGDKIYGLRAHNSGVEMAPTWKMVLKYEHEMRKHMADLVAEGDTIKVAMRKACDSASLRDLYIVTPMALSGVRAPQNSKRNFEDLNDNTSASSNQWYRGNKGRGKGGRGKGGKGGKGNKGGKGGRGKGGAPSQINFKKLKTKVGQKSICFSFNNENENCDGQCGMLHVCQFCLEPDHPKHKCPKNT